MNKIKINGLEIEFESGIEISAEGDRIVIRKTGEAKVKNHIHYHSAPPAPPAYPMYASPFWTIPLVSPGPCSPPYEITCTPPSHGSGTVTFGTIARQ